MEWMALTRVSPDAAGAGTYFGWERVKPSRAALQAGMIREAERIFAPRDAIASMLQKTRRGEPLQRPVTQSLLVRCKPLCKRVCQIPLLLPGQIQEAAQQAIRPAGWDEAATKRRADVRRSTPRAGANDWQYGVAFPRCVHMR